MNILIIDDSALDSYMIRRYFLRNYSASVIICDSVDKANEALCEHSFDLILCDIQMPEKNGLDFVELISAKNIDTPLCFISGESKDVLELAQKMAISSGLSHVYSINKPASSECLDKVILSVITRKDDSRSSILSKNIGHDVTVGDISSALSKKEFYNEYQPKFDFRNESVTGYECLIRWNSSLFGRISPISFIPIFESNGMEYELLNSVLENLIDDFHLFPVGVSFSINISTHLLSNNFVMEEVCNRLEKHGFDLKKITFEITETHTLELSSQTYRNLAFLKMKGVRVSIDDFGTGFSGLSNFVDVPFNEVKIDRKFVQSYLSSNRARNLVTSVVNLCRAEGIVIVVEGIETKEQYDAFKQLPVHLCQGFYTGRPVRASEIK